MQTLRSLRLRIAPICLALALASPAATQAETAELRQLYQDAKYLLAKKRVTQFRQLKTRLADYPLYPYLLLEEIKVIGGDPPSQKIAKLLDETGVPPPGRFVNWWLDRLYSRQQWSEIARHFSGFRSTNVKCRVAEALLRDGQVQAATEAIRPLWLVGRSQHRSCDKAFAIALKYGIITDRLVWERMLLSAARSSIPMYNYLFGKFRSSKWTSAAVELANVHRNPVSTLRSSVKKWAKTEIGHDLIEYSMNRIRSNRPETAANLWHQLELANKLPAEAANRIRLSIGMYLALRHSPLASEWLANMPPDAHTEVSREWWVRAALAENDWLGVLDAIEAMGHGQAQHNAWRYWRAQALKKTGRADDAKKVLTEVAKHSGYYGFLAADAIGAPYPNLQNAEIDEKLLLSQTSHVPAVARIREFLHFNLPYSARREFFALSRNVDSDFLARSAYLYHRWGWHDGAIRSYRKSDAEFHLAVDVMYPLPFLAVVRKESARHSVPMHWIYGIMHRESVFVADIRSGANATGLMQLLFSTAKNEARRQKMGRISRSSLLKPSTNVRIGTGYFKRLLRRADGIVPYALAGYNGGPNNVAAWRKSSRASDLIMWIETIPYSETRRYVKSVLANFVIYELLIESSQRRLTDYLIRPDSQAKLLSHAGDAASCRAAAERQCHA